MSGNAIRQFGYGARVDGGATDHTIRDNDFRGNRIYDCDRSVSDNKIENDNIVFMEEGLFFAPLSLSLTHTH